MTSSTTDQPLISVVMATYNGEKYIIEAIDSILNQTYSNFEFIIIDDGSTDTTATLINNHTDARIRYHKKEKNSGIADSLNIGIDMAQGSFIARMDDDDISYSHRFEKQIEEFQADSDLILCASSANNSFGKFLNSEANHEEIRMKLLFHNCIFHPSVMIKTQVLKENKYNPAVVPSEDYELWSRLITIGKFKILHTPLIFYRSNENSVTSHQRKKQLKLNIPIATYIYNTTRLQKLEHHETHHKNFVSNNYEVSSNNLYGMVNWINDLGAHNAEVAFFDVEKFNKTLQSKLRRYLKSYFANNTNKQKADAFLYLPLKFKLYVLKIYFKKLFRFN